MELPSIMASLHLNDVQSTSEDSKEVKTENEPAHNKPQLRKRSSLSLLSGCVAKKTCKMRVSKSPQTEKDIQDLYLNKKFGGSKLKSTKLETIFEEPKQTACGETITMSVGKQKRAVNFSVTKLKKKKRKCKVKEMIYHRSGQIRKQACKFSTADVLARLTEMMNGDSST